jgi:hypothetical protein
MENGRERFLSKKGGTMKEWKKGGGEEIWKPRLFTFKKFTSASISGISMAWSR